MKEKILELLKTKFNGVSEQTLNRMADKAAKTVADEDAAQAYADGLTFQAVIDSEADYRATKASQTSIENYEKKYGIKEGKATSKKDDDEKVDGKAKVDDIPEWGKSVLEFVNQMAKREKENELKEKKSRIISKLIELGADEKDKDKIQSLVDLAGVTEDVDIDEKSTAILGVYNSIKKPAQTRTPDKTDDDGDVDAFLELLNTAKE